MKRSLCVWLAAATLSVTACGGSSSSNGTGGADGGSNGGTGGGSAGAGGAGGGARGGTSGTGAGGSARDGATDPMPSDVTYDVADVGSSVPIDAAPVTVGEVVCEKVFLCCSDAERAANPIFASQAFCSA